MGIGKLEGFDDMGEEVHGKARKDTMLKESLMSFYTCSDILACCEASFQHERTLLILGRPKKPKRKSLMAIDDKYRYKDFERGQTEIASVSLPGGKRKTFLRSTKFNAA